MKRDEIFKETLKVYKNLKEARIASSLSVLDIYVCLYYEKLSKNDIVIISKAHGTLSLYPILADLGYFDKKELSRAGKNFLGSIADPIIPGIKTINGSLGHGLGVGAGIALGKKLKCDNKSNIIVIMGDGELYEGSVWEAVMFAKQQKLDNLTLIIDNNKTSMLDRTKNIIDLEPLEDKFKAFGWIAVRCDGHNIEKLSICLDVIKERGNIPKVVIADTIKGKGIKKLEQSSLCHVISLDNNEIDRILNER